MNFESDYKLFQTSQTNNYDSQNYNIQNNMTSAEGYPNQIYYYNAEYPGYSLPQQTYNSNPQPVKEKRKTMALEISDPISREKIDISSLVKSGNPTTIRKKSSNLLDEEKEPKKETCSINNLIPCAIQNGNIRVPQVTDYSKTTDTIKVPKEQSSKITIEEPTHICPSVDSQPDVYINISKSRLILTESNNSPCVKNIYPRDTLIEICNKTERIFSAPFLIDDEFKDIITLGIPNNAISLVNKYRTPKRKVDIYDNSSRLRRSTKGYKPPYLRNNEECSNNENLNTFRRSFKIILNKIAPQNLKYCFSEIKDFLNKVSKSPDISTESVINCLIEEIFDKAIKQEAYSVTYAKICKFFAKLDDDSQYKWSFKSTLLNRCKEMFETPLQNQLDSAKLYWENRIKEETDDALKKLIISDLEEQLKKAKDQYFGNVRFIGELYVQDLLKPGIIYNCIMSLLPKFTDQDSMESLCKLLVTCGKMFNAKHPEKIAEIMNNLRKNMKDESLTNKKIRFSIMDIIEMSERKWKLREIQEQKIVRPKTLEEVKIEFDEDKSAAAAAAAIMSSGKNTPRLPNRSSQMRQSASATELKAKVVPQQRKIAIEPNSLCQTVSHSDNFQLKPAYKWASGSGCKTDDWNTVEKRSGRGYKNDSYKRKTDKNSNPAIVVANMSSPNDTDKSDSRDITILERDQSPPTMLVDSKFIQSNKFSALGSCHSDISDSSDVPARTVSPGCEVSSLSDGRSNDYDMTEEELLMTQQELLENLINTKSINIKSWDQLEDVEGFLFSCYDNMMEKDSGTRKCVGLEISKLLRNDKLSLNTLINSLKAFDGEIFDLIIEIPKLWSFLAEFFSAFIRKDGNDSLSDSLKLLTQLFVVVFGYRLPNEQVLLCAALSLKYAQIDRNDTDIRRWLLSVNNDTEDKLIDLVLTETDLGMQSEAFIDNNNQENNPHTTQEDLKVIFARLQQNLMKILAKDEENIYQFLDSKLSIAQMQTEDFVYFMFSCMFKYVLDLSNEETNKFLEAKLLFCNRYLDHRPEFEKKALIALNDFADRLHETNKLSLLVSWLLAENVVSTDAFQQWLEQHRDESHLTATTITSVLNTLSR